MKTEARLPMDWGAEYDAICEKLPMHMAAQRFLADFLQRLSKGINSRIRILEIGCGTGITTREIVSSLKAFDLMAIDLAPSFSKALISPRQSTVEIKTADALSFLVSSPLKWNFIVSAFTFHNWRVPYRTAVLEMIHEMLEPGGWFLNADYYPRESESHAFENHLLSLSQILATINDALITQRWIAHAREDTLPERLMLAEESIMHLQKLGFSCLSIEHLNELVGVVSARRSAV